MFVRKYVVVIFILQNFVSSFCGTVQVDVDSESEGSDSEYGNSNESSDSPEKNYGILFELFRSPLFYFLQIIFTSEHDLFRDLDTNLKKRMASVGGARNSNEDSENNFEEYWGPSTLSWDGDSNESMEEKNDTLDSENNFEIICPVEDHSMISRNDIKYLIQEKAESLKIKENILNIYYPDATEVIKKNLGDLEAFKKRFKERPHHLLHVLHSIASWREQQEPNIKDIAAQLEQFQALEDDFNNVAKGSVVTLKQLEKYKKICKINCEEISTANRFGHEIINNSLIVSNRTGLHCIRLKYLNDYIDKKLNEAQYGEGLNQPLEVIDKLYEQKISNLKNNVKEAAVKQFGNTMYDILSLHDDYHHFMNDLEHANISSKIDNIIENIAEIGFMRIGLKRDLEKYRQYCMKCGSQRVKRNVYGYHKGSTLKDVEELSDVPVKQIYGAETGANFSVNAVVDELIQAKIDEIKEGIQRNFTTMFAALDKIFNDPNVVDSYLGELHSIHKRIEEGIKAEQEALHRLRSRVPQKSIDKIIVLSKESKQMVHNLESAKLFIAQFIQRF